MHKRIIAIARAKRKNKKKYDSDEEVSSDDEYDISCDIVGSLVKNRYLIMKYISKGAFCRVWLAYDLFEFNYCAIKSIFPNYYSDACQEKKILKLIGHDNDYLMNCKDIIEENKNGKPQLYFVCELLGTELFQLVNMYKSSLPLDIIRRIIKDILNGLDYLHRTKDIIHSDLKLENILLTNRCDHINNIIEWFNGIQPQKHIEEVSKLSNEYDNCHKTKKKRLRKKFRKEMYKKLGNIVKEYLLMQIKDTQKNNLVLSDSDGDSVGESDWNRDIYNNTECVDTYLDDRLIELSEKNIKLNDNKLILGIRNNSIKTKICDFGNCILRTDPFIDDIQTRPYRSPEVIIGNDYNTSCDIWSLGCILYELITGDCLFDVAPGKNEIDRDRKHLALMYEVLGKIPKNIALDCKLSNDLFDSKGRVLKYRKDITYTSLEELIIKCRNDIEAFELKQICNLIRKMLDYNPKTRITAEECLKNEWLNIK